MTQPLQAELDSALRTVVDEMSAAAAQLITVLDQEREALASADASALNRAGEAKQLLMRQLEQLDAERVHMRTASLQASQESQPAWGDVLTSLMACRDKNLRNGALVSQRLTQVRRALSVLTGNADADHTYGHSGELKAGYRSVPLAEV
jgi:flagella synthesis protein FlgN